MRAISRVLGVWIAAALFTAGPPALAQDTDQPAAAATNTPATTVGPSDLQNFSLNGTVTQPAPSSTPTPAPSARNRPASGPGPSVAPGTSDRAQLPTRTDRGTTSAAPQTVPLPQFAPPPAAGAATETLPPSTPQGEVPPPPATARPVIGVWPWLLAALVIGGAAALMLRRRRHRLAPADGELDFAAPEVAPLPPTVKPAPPGDRAPQSPPGLGIVSSSLRPWVEIGVVPLRCAIDEQRVAVDFEIELFNSGSSPARAIIAEAAMFNAGANQEQELAAFFARPLGQGEPIDVIPPLNRLGFQSQVVAERAKVQEYELGGKTVMVPVLAFNILYRWSGGQAQTSAAYLVGRESGGQKLGPLAIGEGAREFRGLAARPLPSAVRR